MVQDQRVVLIAESRPGPDGGIRGGGPSGVPRSELPGAGELFTRVER
ncbi:hypothetical protein P1P68_00370 [Streptomyces scabiei]|nr:hypothetical protein [Streptomyces scabiei]MDW8803303.1 hypothetical protein [Streptomyces scabiei]